MKKLLFSSVFMLFTLVVSAQSPNPAPPKDAQNTNQQQAAQPQQAPPPPPPPQDPNSQLSGATPKDRKATSGAVKKDN
jgi:hypothetical protein